MTTISANLQSVRDRITSACHLAGRNPQEITLLAVSKTWPASHIREAAAVGQQQFAESYVQEALPKLNTLRGLAIEWHFIGALQSNKTRHVAENFSWVHSVPNLKVAQRLSAQRPAGLPLLNICIEVKLTTEQNKSGCFAEALPSLCQSIAALPRLKLRGLMTMPEADADAILCRQRFATLRQLRDTLQQQGLAMDTLSMGMSGDLEQAIMEGATIVRVGTAIFGKRTKQ